MIPEEASRRTSHLASDRGVRAAGIQRLLASNSGSGPSGSDVYGGPERPRRRHHAGVGYVLVDAARQASSVGGCRLLRLHGEIVTRARGSERSLQSRRQRFGFTASPRVCADRASRGSGSLRALSIREDNRHSAVVRGFEIPTARWLRSTGVGHGRAGISVRVSGE